MKIILSVVLMLFFFTAPVLADEHAIKREKAEKYAQKIIQYCHDISEAERSQPDIETINVGHEKTIKCLQDNYIEIYNLVAKSKISAQELEQQFKLLRDPYITMYAQNADIDCVACGSMTSNIALSQYAHLLEQIFSNMIYNIYIHDVYYLLK